VRIDDILFDLDHWLKDGQRTFDEEIARTQALWQKRVDTQLAEKADEDAKIADTQITAVNKALESGPIRGFRFKRPTRHLQSDRQLATSNRFVGIPVAVVFKHPLKGMWGIVVGDHDSPERRQRLDMETKAGRKHRIDDTAGILVTIRQNAGNKIEDNIPIENLLHRK
jgi:hypothetical protein